LESRICTVIFVLVFLREYLVTFFWMTPGCLPFKISKGGLVALKSQQVRKFTLVAPQRKLRFSKAQLRSLHFKLLDAVLIATFMTAIC
jgi:hypothetical protein